MSNLIKNSIGLRQEMEKLRIGLNAAGSYVLASLDEDALNHFKQINFAEMEWLPEEWVLEVKGTKRSGTLVRFAQISSDGRYCRFPVPYRYLSPRLLKTNPTTKRDFVAPIANNPTLRIKKFNDVERVGILVGPRDAKYKSLISLDGDRLIAVDIEENPPLQSSAATTAVLEDDPPEGAGLVERLVETFGR